MPSEPLRECRRVIYHGRVQGVGFRWTSSRIARRYQVDGYVKNLADGSVELLVQGDPKEVTAFVEDVAETMSANISHVDQVEEPVQDNLSSFTIRH